MLSLRGSNTSQVLYMHVWYKVQTQVQMQSCVDGKQGRQAGRQAGQAGLAGQEGHAGQASRAGLDRADLCTLFCAYIVFSHDSRIGAI